MEGRGLSAIGRLARGWSMRNQRRLLVAASFSVLAMLFAFLLSHTIALQWSELYLIVNCIAAGSAAFIFLSVAVRDTVPIVSAALGILLMYNATMLPFYSADTDPANLAAGRVLYSAGVVRFLLGAGMAAFAIILAHRPSVLFARGRPPASEGEWSSYPVWSGNPVLVGGRAEPLLPIRQLMKDEEVYLLWRYESVLARIYGSVYLVSPNALVPSSTMVLREHSSGRMLGRPRFSGYFV